MCFYFREIYKEMDAIKLKLSQLKRRTCVDYKRELKKLELVHNEKYDYQICIYFF